jgi:excisionase family DNA binding protein
MKLVIALLRTMAEFVADGNDALARSNTPAGAAEELNRDDPQASSIVDPNRSLTISPALKALLGAVIDSLSDDEAARYLSIGVRQVRRRALDGRLFFFRVGRKRRYPRWQFAADRYVLPGLPAVTQALPRDWSPERVQAFMENKDPRLRLRGTSRPPVEWLLSGGDPSRIAELIADIHMVDDSAEVAHLAGQERGDTAAGLGEQGGTTKDWGPPNERIAIVPGDNFFNRRDLVMNHDGARPWLRAEDEARRLPIDEVVVRLRAVLGARLVAYIGNVTTTSVVQAWADGKAVPDAENDARLRTAVYALGTLELRLDPVTIGTWFKGMNPILGDESPARFIRLAPPDGAGDVLVAARSMLIN